MKTIRVLSTITATLAFVLCSAQASPGVSDDFQSYADDASLTATWSRVSGSVDSIFLAPDPTDAMNQTIQQTTAAGRLRYSLTEGLTPTVDNPLVFSFDLYDTVGAAGTSGRVYGEVRNSGTASGLLAAGIYNTVNTGVYDVNKYQARNLDSGSWIQLNADRSEGWHNFRFEIGADNASLYVDDILDPSFSSLSLGGGIAYDWVHIGSGLSGNTSANFDNVYFSVIPEPSTFALLALGGAVLAFSRFRKQR